MPDVRRSVAVSRRCQRYQKKVTLKGSFQPVGFAVMVFLFVAGTGYLYSVNQNAVQGFHMRNLEREISRLKDENAQLQITEADMRSLYRLQSAVENTSMRKIEEITVLKGNTETGKTQSESIALR